MSGIEERTGRSMLGWIDPSGVAPARMSKADATEVAPEGSVIKPRLRPGFVFGRITRVNFPSRGFGPGNAKIAGRARRTFKNPRIGACGYDRCEPPATAAETWPASKLRGLAGKLPKDHSV